MRLKGFYIGRPQRVAALLLLILFGECLWTIAYRPLDTNDYRYARCGREMWESPSAITGYYTTCGNLNGDGTFAYRAAGLPLTLQRLVLLSIDHFRAPKDRLYPGGSLNGSIWESRHLLTAVNYLLRMPFCIFAIWLGGGLWWVSKRLFGPHGGALALALYVFCPAVIHYATTPNNEVLAMWGLYGMVYTAMGVAHALQGPRRKWKARIALLTVALGLTTAAHLLAGFVALIAGTIFFYYLADRRRSYVAQIMIFASFGAMFIDFAFFGFRPAPFTYVFSGGSMRFWFSLEAARMFIENSSNAGILIATAVALIVFFTTKRTRYFGNIAPLLMVLALVPLYTSQVSSAPWFWALPFLFTFIGGVFADMLETRQRKLFLVLSTGIVVTQAALCWMSMAGIAG
jgi:hypothetical protein